MTNFFDAFNPLHPIKHHRALIKFVPFFLLGGVIAALLLAFIEILFSPFLFLFLLSDIHHITIIFPGEFLVIL